MTQMGEEGTVDFRCMSVVQSEIETDVQLKTKITSPGSPPATHFFLLSSFSSSKAYTIVKIKMWVWSILCERNAA
jgi:hypothetical protein